MTFVFLLTAPYRIPARVFESRVNGLMRVSSRTIAVPSPQIDELQLRARKVFIKAIISKLELDRPVVRLFTWLPAVHHPIASSHGVASKKWPFEAGKVNVRHACAPPGPQVVSPSMSGQFSVPLVNAAATPAAIKDRSSAARRRKAAALPQAKDPSPLRRYWTPSSYVGTDH